MTENQIHETAIIDDDVEIGTGCKVWHWVYIKSGSVIGDNCRFGQSVYVASDVRIGNNVNVQANASIYEEVTLEDDVFVGPGVSFTNVRNPRSGISRSGSLLATYVEQGASLGANCTIICGVNIGRYAMVGAGAVINKSVPDFALMVGVPAVQIGWVSCHGDRIDLPLMGNGVATCAGSGVVFQLIDGVVSIKERPQ